MTEKFPHYLKGTVTGHQNKVYAVIETDAPETHAHLKHMNVIARYCVGGLPPVGAKGSLRFIITGNGCQWHFAPY